MATLTWVYNGLEEVLEFITNNLAPGNLKLRLYTNLHAVVIGDTAAALTECTLTGYAAVTTVAANWVLTQQTGYYAANYPSVTYTFAAYGGGTIIEGFYITDAAGALICGAALDTPFSVPAGGGSLTISLEIDTIQY